MGSVSQRVESARAERRILTTAAKHQRLAVLMFALLFARAEGADAVRGAAGTVLRLGTNEITAGRALPFGAVLNGYARTQLNAVGTNVSVVSAALVLPENWHSTPRLPLLVVCSPSGTPSIRQLGAYTNIALSEGWAVLAADGPPLPFNRDTVQWNWGTVSSALDQLHTVLPQSRAWPLAFGGFSGGSKRAACLAAAAIQERYEVRGVFAGGCNEDAASAGARLYHAGPSFLQTPFFLSNGREDQIAGPGHGAAVSAAMKRSGFRRVRTELYDGGHRLEPAQLRLALRWFREAAAGR